MARVEIPAPGDLVMDSAGNVRVGEAVTLTLAGTLTAATHYSALTAGTSTTGGLTTGSDGTIVDGSGSRRYIDEGSYDLTILGRLRRIEAVSGNAQKGASYSLVEAGVTFYATAALADAGTDATTLINTAATTALAAGQKLVDGKGGFVKVTGTVTFPDIDLDLSGTTFRADLALTSPARTTPAARTAPSASAT
jgi:hypothetical protein